MKASGDIILQRLESKDVFSSAISFCWLASARRTPLPPLLLLLFDLLPPGSASSSFFFFLVSFFSLFFSSSYCCDVQCCMWCQGLGATYMYCGDGINDLLVLAAADVGMAIGCSHASAAAAICSRRPSVEGLCLLLAICTICLTSHIRTAGYTQAAEYMHAADQKLRKTAPQKCTS